MNSPKPKSMLVTSEMMQEAGIIPELFTGGACNIQSYTGPIRNPGRDWLAAWLDEKGVSYFDPQIHPSTHGREYVWGIDGPQEKRARERAKLRIYEITAETISAITMLEIMDDARAGRTSIVWYNGGKIFAPLGIGDHDQLKKNEALKRNVGNMVYSHLLAYINAGRQLRDEIRMMLADCLCVVFVNSADELKSAISYFLSKLKQDY
ncbi:MAG: hypothetical protein GY862_14955 [Gammaproteobacteria bacterium]|nr:hypothetical protein [Gammaproteobacteria bacterium]